MPTRSPRQRTGEARPAPPGLGALSRRERSPGSRQLAGWAAGSALNNVGMSNGRAAPRPGPLPPTSWRRGSHQAGPAPPARSLRQRRHKASGRLRQQGLTVPPCWLARVLSLRWCGRPGIEVKINHRHGREGSNRRDEENRDHGAGSRALPDCHGRLVRSINGFIVHCVVRVAKDALARTTAP
jgi:hypothetical protein